MFAACQRSLTRTRHGGGAKARVKPKPLIIGFFAKSSPHAYIQDGLVSLHRNSFMQDPAFQRAYRRGVQSTGGIDPICGTGVFMLAGVGQRRSPATRRRFCRVWRQLWLHEQRHHGEPDWDRLGKTFYLLDTFQRT